MPARAGSGRCGVAKRVLLLLAHAIEEYDQVALLSGLGYDVFSIGAYSDPAHPDVDVRPPLPNAPDHPELREACHAKRVEHVERGREKVLTLDGPRDPVDWAKADLPAAVFDWADVIICHHFEHTWLWPQWPRLREKRVIWRTVGQSVEHNEWMMAPLRRDGLQVVRYSPKERNIPGYAGEDALIRFYKDPDEWTGWTGEESVVINVTQNLRDRHPFTNYEFWDQATQGLPRMPLGPGSETHGGAGSLTYEEMRGWLRRARAYLYTGTQPASYTLGLIEAMMTGIPVVSIGPAWMRVFPYGPLLFEGHELAPCDGGSDHNDPAEALAHLALLLSAPAAAETESRLMRERAIGTFGKATVAAAWRDFLGAP